MWNKLGILAGIVSTLVALVALYDNLAPGGLVIPELKKENPYTGLLTDLGPPTVMISDSSKFYKGDRIGDIEVIDISPIKNDTYHLLLKMRVTFFYDKRHQKSENTPPRAQVNFNHDGGGILKFKRIDSNWGRTTYTPLRDSQVIQAYQPISIKIRLEAAEFQSEQFFVSLYEYGQSRREFFYNVMYKRRYTWIRPL